MDSFENTSESRIAPTVTGMNFTSLTYAYLKPVATKGGNGFAVFDANGEQLAVFDSRDAAFFAAKQHDLEPVLLH